MAIGQVITPIAQDWTKPADWIDISNVADNEINLLVSDGSMAFQVYTASGTYSIDWGDGTIETGRASATTYQHTYVLGSGTATSYGYTQYKIRIYGALSNITRFLVSNPVITNATQARGLPLLWMVMGTNGLTSLQFLAGVTNATYCPALQQVTLPSVLTGVTRMDTAFIACTSLQQVIGLDSTWGSVTTTQQMFDNCVTIRRVNLPPVLPDTITTMNGMFNSCANLTTINLPTNWPSSVTDLSSLFSGCIGLRYITIPSSWSTGLTTTANMFSSCNSLETITLPSTGFPNSVTTMASMFNGCFSLTSIDLGTNWGTSTTNVGLLLGGCRSLQKVILPSNSNNITNAISIFQGAAPNSAVIQSITNLDKLGSTTGQTDFSTFISSNLYLTGSYTLNAAISKVGWNGGGATSKTVLTGLRLPNTSSLFVGTSPQVNVSYTNMEIPALETLFTDLKSNTTGSINITGCNGTTGNTTTVINLTSGSNVVTVGSGLTILSGSEVTIGYSGSMAINWIVCNPTPATSTLVPVSPTTCNAPNGKIGYFTSTPGSWALPNTPYYIVNSTPSSFQISLTQGGLPIGITGSIAQTLFAYCANVTSVTGSTLTLDTTSRSTITYSGSIAPLHRIGALARGWSVTG